MNFYLFAFFFFFKVCASSTVQSVLQMETVPRSISGIQLVSIQSGLSRVATLLPKLLFGGIRNQSRLSPLPHSSELTVAMKVKSELGGNSCSALEQEERGRES